MKRFLTIMIFVLLAFAGGLWTQSTYNILGDYGESSGLNTGVNPGLETARIKDTLTRQSAAWSAGDIDRFMQDYWKSDDLRFASGGTVKRGWQITSDRYKARYPDKATMGTLAFTDLEVEVLAPTHALVFGRWTLTRDEDAPTGLFTLHMENQNGAWKIVSDHTSSATP